MWIDENEAVHTVWVPARDILGEDAVAALRALPPGERAAAQAELDARFDDILAAVTPDAARGPATLNDAEDPAGDERTAPPPLVPGLAPRAGESLATSVLTWLDQVPAQWRLEAFEAVAEVLEELGEER
jgi:hypothetical protein